MLSIDHLARALALLPQARADDLITGLRALVGLGRPGTP